MRRLIIQLVEINQLAEFLLDPLFCQAKFLQRIVLFTFEMGRRPFARLTAHGRFPDKKGCKTADQAGSRVASAQWRSNKNHPPNLRPVSKEQFLAKILARFRRERHLVRRPAENLHPKLIAAVGKKQPADATTHAGSDYHHRFEFRKLLLHLIEFLAQDRRRIRKWITGRVTVEPELVMLSHD